MDVDAIRKVLAGNKSDLLMAVVGLEGIVTFAFVICTFAVATTANAGFNVVLTGFLNIGFIAGSYHVIRKSKAPIAVSDDNILVTADLHRTSTTDRLPDWKWLYDDIAQLYDFYILGSAQFM